MVPLSVQTRIRSSRLQTPNVRLLVVLGEVVCLDVVHFFFIGKQPNDYNHVCEESCARGTGLM